MNSYRRSVLTALFARAGYSIPAPSPAPSPSPAPAPNPSFPLNGVPVLPINQTFTPQLDGVPVEGKSIGYKMPASFTGNIVAQQWYRNAGDGTGPILAAGATDPTFPVSHSDIAYWLSVALEDDQGNIWRSPEFVNQAQPLGNSGVQIGDPLTAGGFFNLPATNSGVTNALTLYGVATIRIFDNQHRTAFIDNYLAPGTYPAFSGGRNYQEAVLFAATGGSGDSNTRLYVLGQNAAPKVIAQSPAPAATATRPAGNTGNGFYVAANGYMYDPLGNVFMPYGFNVVNGEFSWPGVPNAKPNIVRNWIDASRSDFNLPAINTLISQGIVPMITTAGAWARFSATFGGSDMKTMTVTAMTGTGNPGRVYVGMQLLVNDGNTAFLTCTITDDNSTDNTLTGTGLTGTYRVSVAQTVTVSVSLKNAPVNTTNAPSVNHARAMIQRWCDLAPKFTPLNKYIMLNPLNEWGYLGTTNTTWRDFWKNEAIPMLRAAGYTCPIVIDAPGTGQDSQVGGVNAAWTLINHGPAVAASDTFKNVMFSLHIYNFMPQGQLSQSTLPQLANLRDTQGMAFIIGEFGQGQKNFDVDSATTNIEVMSSCVGCGFGYMPWVWDLSFQQTPRSIPSVDNTKYSMVYDYSKGYGTSDDADLTEHGDVIVNHPVFGLKAIAQQATAGWNS